MSDAANLAKSQEAEDQGIVNPIPTEAPPPYQPTAPPQNYGAAEPVPPAYDRTGPAEPPPSYDSIYGQVQAAKQESNSVAEFFKKFLIILLSTLGCTICVGLLLAVPVSMIVMGGRYLFDCPREKYIPIYLLVGGCFGVLKNLSSIIQRVKNRQEDRDTENARTNPFDGTVNCFLIAWFIAGSIWVYDIQYSFNPNDETSPMYCNPVLYNYAFWLTSSVYIIMFTILCGCCVVGTFLSCCCNRDVIEDEQELTEIS